MLLVDTEGLDCSIVGSMNWSSPALCFHNPEMVVYEQKWCSASWMKKARDVISQRRECARESEAAAEADQYRRIGGGAENSVFARGELARRHVAKASRRKEGSRKESSRKEVSKQAGGQKAGGQKTVDTNLNTNRRPQALEMTTAELMQLGGLPDAVNEHLGSQKKGRSRRLAALMAPATAEEEQQAVAEEEQRAATEEEPPPAARQLASEHGRLAFTRHGSAAPSAAPSVGCDRRCRRMTCGALRSSFACTHAACDCMAHIPPTLLPSLPLLSLTAYLLCTP